MDIGNAVFGVGFIGGEPEGGALVISVVDDCVIGRIVTETCHISGTAAIVDNGITGGKTVGVAHIDHVVDTTGGAGIQCDGRVCFRTGVMNIGTAHIGADIVDDGIDGNGSTHRGNGAAAGTEGDSGAEGAGVGQNFRIVPGVQGNTVCTGRNGTAPRCGIGDVGLHRIGYGVDRSRTRSGTRQAATGATGATQGSGHSE